MKKSYSLHVNPFRTLPSSIPVRPPYATQISGQSGTVVVTDEKGPLYSQRVGGLNLYTLALACAYLLIEGAIVNFPTSSPAAPSRRVLVTKASGPYMRDGDGYCMPQEVDWRVWDRAVVPVLEDESLRRFDRRDWDEFVLLIEGMLLNSFVAAGYLPS